MELTYTEQNGLLIPDLVLDDQPPGSLGKYDRMRKRYLEQKHDGTFSALVLSGKLTEHLLDIDRTAKEQLEEHNYSFLVIHSWCRRNDYTGKNDSVKST